MAKESTAPTLSEFAYVGRQSIKYGAVLLVVMIVGRTFLTAAVSYWRAVNPPPPPPPTVGFGILPPIEFPVTLDEDKPTSYKLETATGSLPSLGDRAPVYLLNRSVPSLLQDQESRAIANELNFIFPPDVLDPTKYRFSRTEPIQTVLDINIETKDFEISSDFFNRPELLAQSELPDQLEAVKRVKSMLQDTDLTPEDMATAAGETTYLKVVGTDVETALSFSDADVIEVRLRRNPILSKYKIFTPKNNQGNLYALVTGAFNGTDSVIKAEYHYQPIDYTQMHTYPIRTPQQAWQLLQGGEGYVVTKGEFDTATVRTVELGYFDTFDEQDYLQPIYVFEGDGGFMGYVPAIDPKFIQK